MPSVHDRFTGPLSGLRHTVYRALGRDRLAGPVTEAGFVDAEWRMPHETGFFQPLLMAHADK